MSLFLQGLTQWARRRSLARARLIVTDDADLVSAWVRDPDKRIVCLNPDCFWLLGREGFRNLSLLVDDADRARSFDELYARCQERHRRELLPDGGDSLARVLELKLRETLAPFLYLEDRLEARYGFGSASRAAWLVRDERLRTAVRAFRKKRKSS